MAQPADADPTSYALTASWNYAAAVMGADSSYADQTLAYYSVGDTLSLEDQNLEYNVCHSDGNYEIGDSFSFSNCNGAVNGGDYKVSLISMNATW